MPPPKISRFRLCRATLSPCTVEKKGFLEGFQPSKPPELQLSIAAKRNIILLANERKIDHVVRRRCGCHTGWAVFVRCAVELDFLEPIRVDCI